MRNRCRSDVALYEPRQSAVGGWWSWSSKSNMTISSFSSLYTWDCLKISRVVVCPKAIASSAVNDVSFT